MDMPEGWKNAKASLCPDYNATQYHLNEGLDFIKRMAEALEKCKYALEFADLEPPVEVLDVLDDFEEWE